jgi:hypothetical protein
MGAVAPSLGQNAASTADLSRRIASGYYADPRNDPTFQGAVSSVVNPLTSNLFSSILPGIKDTSLRAGGTGTGPSAYGSATGSGGSPQDVMTENVLQSWGQNLSNTIGSMANASHNAGLSLFGLVPGLNTSGITTALAPSLAELQAGQAEQGFGQNTLDNLIKRYMAQTGLPLSFEQQAGSIGASGGFGTKTGSQTGPPPNLATQWLQGGTGGASILNSLFGSGPGGGPSMASNLGSSLMSGLGAAGSWLNGLNLGGLVGVPAASAFLA